MGYMLVRIHGNCLRVGIQCYEMSSIFLLAKLVSVTELALNYLILHSCRLNNERSAESTSGDNHKRVELDTRDTPC